MFNSHPDGKLSPLNSNCPSPPDLATLAAALQEAAQALLAHVPGEPKEPTQSVFANKPQEPAAEARSSRKEEGETRSFYFPPASVRLERDLLRKYHDDDFPGLLEEVHKLLVGLVKIMKSVHKDVRVKGYVISSLGAQLDHASALVLRMRNVYEKVARLQS